MKRLWKRAVCLVVAGLLFTAPFRETPAAADAVETEVHVALFVKTNTYTALTGAVTLSADNGLRLSDGDGGAWLTTSDASPVRATFDGYSVLVAETSEEKKAGELAAELKKAKQQAAVFVRNVKGSPRYRVEAGPFGTLAEAEANRNALAGNAAIAAKLGGAALTVTGPLYAKVSAHPTEAAALAAAGPLWDAGLYAVTALTRSGAGGLQYEVWLGRAASDAALRQAISAGTAAVPGLAAVPVPQGTRYIVLQSDRAGDAGLGAAVRHAAVGGDGAKLTAGPAFEPSGIRVAERSSRTYRGVIDVFAHNGALAVINRVGMNSYVASVVGSELGPSWPAEVLKAQAVAARTYALKQGWKYGIANVTDTTADQAYYGIEREYPETAEAARATAGERLVLPDGTLLDAFYHSNAGDRTADPIEVWNVPVAGIVSVPSPDDAAEKDKLLWYRAVLPDGSIGYVRSDYVKLTGVLTAAGFPEGTAKESGVNVRAAPYVDNAANPAIAQLNSGDAVTVIGSDKESTAYRWIRGPIAADRLLLQMNASGIASSAVAGIRALQSIEITKRGSESGRVEEVAVNGNVLQVSRPEQYRTLFSLPSTRFEVEATADVTVLGAGGRKTELPMASGTATLTAASANGGRQLLAADAYLVYDGGDSARVVTRGQSFRFHGMGFGHGMGMSQWGALTLSELGYDYRNILLYYYKEAMIVKE